ITNVFETQDTKLDYSFCKNLKDGKGFTCGFAGFSTATGTALSVITDYRKDHLRSPFGKYFISLLRFSNQTDCNLVKGDPSNFDGFGETWRRASCQASFRKSQHRAVDIHFFEPAIKLANEVGVQSYLGKAIFYDTAFQHGYQTDDGFSLRSIIRLAGPMIGSEVDYLDRFLRIRRRILCCYPDLAIPLLADRVEDFQRLLKAGNTRLSPPIQLETHQVTITGQEPED
ncbi:lysozyme-like protein, partial [Basidiobolus meristosporus CBS 931.73]